jgi:serine protease Do
VVDVEGLKLTALTPDLRKQFDLPDQTKGVVVTAVAADSVASERGLKAGDVIVEINQEEVHAPADIKAKIKSARDGGRKSVLMLIDHRGDLRFIALTLG